MQQNKKISFKKCSFFLNGPDLPPTPLNGLAIREDFFCSFPKYLFKNEFLKLPPGMGLKNPEFQQTMRFQLGVNLAKVYIDYIESHIAKPTISHGFHQWFHQCEQFMAYGRLEDISTAPPPPRHQLF